MRKINLLAMLFAGIFLMGGNCGPDDSSEPAPEPEPTDACENIFCDPGLHCEVFPVACVTAPCPEQPLCVEDAPPSTCAETTCPEGEICEMVQVQCVTTPCPPLPTCVTAAPAVTNCLAATDCEADEVCDVQNYCDPDPSCAPGENCIALCYGRCMDNSAGTMTP